MKYLGILLLLLVAAAQANTPVAFRYKDWDTQCDNVGTCRTAGYTSIGDNIGSNAALVFTRHAGPKQPVYGSLYLDSFDRSSAAPPIFSLWLNGKSLGEVPADLVLTASQVTALVNALPGSAHIAVKGASKTWHISDAGASAAFRKIDVVQQRLNTPTAMLVKGSRAESQVPVGPKLPHIRAAKVIDNKARIVKKDDPLYRPLAALMTTALHHYCDMPDSFRQGSAYLQQIHYARLSSDKALVMQMCWTAAYNEGYLALLINTKPPYQPERVTDSASYYSGATLMLEQKGRGYGDCRTFKRWDFDGSHFVKSGETNDGPCRGIPGGVSLDIYDAVIENHN
ncbi:DUF1176 domain-containing protein [Gallaecimonas mangrovi]|uniref:DUF1176 domain-containing protein n=1 Tax=Gallaecimonas mangrovi TaxID=2291597 RepID=UPI000E20B8BC|nr:DUF1176 domain-containing protein [Gallaecimonas mangrovi]